MLHETSIFALTFSSDSCLLASGCKDGHIKVNTRKFDEGLEDSLMNHFTRCFVFYRYGNCQLVNV